MIGQAIGVRHFHVAQSDMQLLDRLNARRADIERVFGRVTKPVPAAPTGADGQSSISTADCGLSLDAPEHADRIASDIDAAFVEALFVTGPRRRWPSDPGSILAATHCLKMGLASSHLDAAGHRWIARVRKAH